MTDWKTDTRGVNQDTEAGYYDEQDWDGKSCMDDHRLPGRGIRDVESMTMLDGLRAEQDTP